MQAGGHRHHVQHTAVQPHLLRRMCCSMCCMRSGSHPVHDASASGLALATPLLLLVLLLLLSVLVVVNCLMKAGCRAARWCSADQHCKCNLGVCIEAVAELDRLHRCLRQGGGATVACCVAVASRGSSGQPH
jgi:hypothetical protein